MGVVFARTPTKTPDGPQQVRAAFFERVGIALEGLGGIRHDGDRENAACPAKHTDLGGV